MVQKGVAAKVLVITDDPYYFGRVTSAVSSLPVECGVSYTRDAGRALSSAAFDAVVLDAKDQTGAILELAERLAMQSNGAGTNLTTKTSLLVQVRADDLHAVKFPAKLHCDFIVETASGDELAARLRLMLWPREVPSHEELVVDGNVAIDLATYQVYINGDPVDFAYLEYALFSFLVTHPNRTHTRDQLLRRVWGGAYYGGSRTVDVHVRRVRAKLDPASAQRLETVRGIGYLWRSADAVV